MASSFRQCFYKQLKAPCLCFLVIVLIIVLNLHISSLMKPRDVSSNTVHIYPNDVTILKNLRDFNRQQEKLAFNSENKTNMYTRRQPVKQIPTTDRVVKQSRTQRGPTLHGRGFKYPLDIDMIELVQKKIDQVKVDIDEINPHPFKYIHASETCKFSKPEMDLTLLILVKSSAENKHLREGIRKSWGNIGNRVAYTKLIFLLGYKEQYQKQVDSEAFLYNDIVQEDFVDAYFNNTFKTIMAFNWGVSHCPGAKFLFFVDDDHMVILHNLITYLSTIHNNNLDRVFTGFVIPHSRPFRDAKSKWNVPVSEYPNDFWPPYLAGGAFVVSQRVAVKFKLAFPYVKYMRIDDSYLGIVAKKLQIKPLMHSRFYQLKSAISLNLRPVFIASHGFKNVTELVNLHTILTDNLNKTFLPPPPRSLGQKAIDKLRDVANHVRKDK